MSENNGICPKCGNYEQIGGHACIVPSVATNSTAPTMSEKATSNLDRYIAIAKQQMSRPSPMPENAYSNEFVSMLIARIDTLTAENERLRGLCGQSYKLIDSIVHSPAYNSLLKRTATISAHMDNLDRASKEKP